MKPIVHTIRFAAVAAMAAALTASACGRESVTEPTPIVRDPAPAPIVTYTVSGVISEITDSGEMPLEGVHVENSESHDVTITDGDGFYSLGGFRAGMARLNLSKEGYELQFREVAVEGDVRFDAVMIPQDGSISSESRRSR